jgi:hypothetical protein
MGNRRSVRVNKKNRIALNELSNVQKKAVLGVVGRTSRIWPRAHRGAPQNAPEGALEVDAKLVYQYLKRKGLNTESKA